MAHLKALVAVVLEMMAVGRVSEMVAMLIAVAVVPAPVRMVVARAFAALVVASVALPFLRQSPPLRNLFRSLLDTHRRHW